MWSSLYLGNTGILWKQVVNKEFTVETDLEMKHTLLLILYKRLPAATVFEADTSEATLSQLMGLIRMGLS